MNKTKWEREQVETMETLLREAEQDPSIDRAEYLLRHGVAWRASGEWIRDDTYQGKHRAIYVCSQCLHWQSVAKAREQKMYMNYCPFCGAAMARRAENNESH